MLVKRAPGSFIGSFIICPSIRLLRASGQKVHSIIWLKSLHDLDWGVCVCVGVCWPWFCSTDVLHCKLIDVTPLQGVPELKVATCCESLGHSYWRHSYCRSSTSRHLGPGPTSSLRLSSLWRHYEMCWHHFRSIRVPRGWAPLVTRPAPS